MKKTFLLTLILIATIFFSTLAQAECVDNTALANYITQWKTDSTAFTMPQLMLKIADWKSGAGCGTGIIAASIVASRVECVAPCAVFFDATDTIATTTESPFHELDYTWNFGDPSSGNWATNGKPKNSAKGGVAAHVFENAGSYTITLDVKDMEGNTDTKTVQVDVESPDVVFASNSVCIAKDNLNWNGCPAGAEHVVTDDISTALNTNITNGKRRLLLRRGDSWTTFSMVNISQNGPGIIGAFGSGDKPLINGAGTSAIFLLNGNWSIIDNKLIGQNPNAMAPAIINYENSSNKLVLRVDVMNNFAGGFYTSWSTTEEFVFLVDSSFNNIGSNGITSNNIGFIGRSSAILGTQAIGRQGNNEHSIRVFHANKFVLEESIFMDPWVEQGKVALKLHNAYNFNQPYSQYVVISNNVFRGTVAIQPQNARCIPIQDGGQEQIKEVIFERNTIYPQLGRRNATANLMMILAKNITVRNNIIDHTLCMEDYCNGISLYSYDDCQNYVQDIFIYNNIASYINNSAKEFYFLSMPVSASNVFLKNNIGYNPLGTKIGNGLIMPGLGEPTNKSNNIFYSPSSQSTDPQFVDTINGNFHLQETSPAINNGTAVPVFEDFDGNLRPQGLGYDIGAFEYH